METTNQKNNNDLPVAKVLNTLLLTVVACVRQAEEMDLPEDYEIGELNRAYILIVNELEELYRQNPQLADIEPEPFWKKFDVLKGESWDMLNYLDDPINDKGRSHTIRLERLCIIANSENPELTQKHIELITNTAEAIQNYQETLDNARLDINSKIEDSWYIPAYKLFYETNGTILINGVLKLKKTHIESAIDKLLEQAFQSPEVLFTPELGRTSRNLSTVLSSAGFTPVLRQIFFPIANESKGVLFRPKVTFEQATNDGIDTTELDLLLKALGADVNFSA